MATENVEVAVALYSRRQISLGKTAEIAEIPIWRMNQILVKHDVWLDYTAKDADQDWNTLCQVFAGALGKVNE